MAIANADIEYIAIENPIGIMSSVWRKPDQIIQPWQYGHGETKSTCLWLKRLPKLQPTNIVEGREQKVWRMPPGKDRTKLRSKTYQGIAKAMASQWRNVLAGRKVAVGCEESQAVTIEMRLAGIEAYSIDILECSGGHPEWHIQKDLLEELKESE